MLIATFELPHTVIALEETFRDIPELELEAERVAAHSTEWVMPCLWMTNADRERLEGALSDDPSVATIVESHEFDDEIFFQLDWDESVQERISRFIDKEGSIVEANATDAGWEVTVRFASREQFDTFREYLQENERPFVLRRLTEPGSPRQTAGNLTSDQRDALVAALERGYFDVPRGISAEELADELGMAHQSMSELLRRGTANLVDTTLVTDPARSRT